MCGRGAAVHNNWCRGEWSREMGEEAAWGGGWGPDWEG